MSERRYIIRKYVNASSVREALDKEPSTDVEEVFVDDKPTNELRDAVGFKYLPAGEQE